MKRITFTPVKKDNNWVIEQTMIVGTFSSEDECKQACKALEQKYSMKDWDDDLFFKQRLREISIDLFYGQPKPTEEVIRKYSEMQEPIQINKPKPGFNLKKAMDDLANKLKIGFDD